MEKTDKDTGAALKGAEFELRDADGKVVETLTTDENGHATSGLLAIGTYKDGKLIRQPFIIWLRPKHRKDIRWMRPSMK